jgi:hypothetical protein
VANVRHDLSAVSSQFSVQSFLGATRSVERKTNDTIAQGNNRSGHRLRSPPNPHSVPHALIRAEVDAHRQPHTEVLPSRLAHRRPSRRYGGPRHALIRATCRARIGAAPHNLWTASAGAHTHAPEGVPTRLGAPLASRMLRQYLVGP